MVSKMGVMLREHEIQKSIWRYYTSENGDCRLNTRLDVCKLQKFSNRSGACIVAKTVIFRLAAVATVGFQKHPGCAKSSRSVGSAAVVWPAEG